jgi:hypothetical protein
MTATASLPATRSDIGVGDKVIINRSGWYSRRAIATVTKVTKTQIMTDQSPSDRWRRTDGRRVGDTGYNNPWLTCPKSPEELLEVERENYKADLLLKFRTVPNWSKYDLDTLDRVATLLKLT